MTHQRMQRFDYVLVGGGLSNALLSLALAARRPGAKVAVVEGGARLGGNHTWCFHAADVPAAAAAFVEPLVVQRWPGYFVHFPSSERHLAEQYAAVTSEQLHRVISELSATAGGPCLFLSQRATHVAPHRVQLASGAVLHADLVVDARGPDALAAQGAAGFQKFVGLELEVEPSAQPALPTVMDARVPQRDGFRFFYVLPLASGRVLVEDTYFSDSAELGRARLRREIELYAASHGLMVKRVLREEAGVLPLPKGGIATEASRPGIVYGGYQGGWFHPTTGYSFPLAVRLAHEITSADGADLQLRLEHLARERRSQQRFCTLLNRMLFDAFEPEQRFAVLERFYRLPAPTIARFYALALSPADRLRILCGRPPAGMSLGRLLKSHSSQRHPAALGENA